MREPHVLVPRGGKCSQEKSRARFSPKISRASAAPTPISLSTLVCSANTAAFHPRGKNDESVPNNSRLGPNTSSARRKTVFRSRPSYRIHELLLDVSRYTFGQRSPSISASRKKPAP